MARINMNSREFQKMISENGFVFHHQTGDHRIWYRGTEHISVTSKKLNPMIAQRLVKEFKLKVR